MASGETDPDRTGEPPADPGERVRALVERVVETLDLEASVVIEESETEIRATVEGDELDLLIGTKGETIDALQYIASRAMFTDSGERKAIVIDAAGYRERREHVLQQAAERAVTEALASGRPVELEPMSAPERKIVHQYLGERADVETYSEGQEPGRRLVVTPVARA